MFIQLALGSLIMVITILVASASWWILESLVIRLHPWAMRPPHGAKLMVILTLSLFAMLWMLSVAVWVWAITLFGLGIFETMEASVYFALVAFTTLGFGDVLLPTNWQLLSGLAAANGLLLFGLMAAVFVEVLRETRLRQRGHPHVPNGTSPKDADD